MAGEPSRLAFGAIELRLDERRVFVAGQPVALGSRAFDLLKALVSKRDRVVGKDELLDEVWPGLVVEENNLQVQISGLRRVLGAGAIATVPGYGYRFVQAAEPGRSEAPPPTEAAADADAFVAADVLVADDNRVNRLLLCRSLQLLGHRVSTASNGREALAQLRSQRFDLLLLDLAMPELDGFAVLQQREADAALRDVAVIVTSAMGGVAPVARCIELGADDFLHKPVDPSLLKARVVASLARKRQQDRQRQALLRALPSGPAQPCWREDATLLLTQMQADEDGGNTPEALLDLLSTWCTLASDAVLSRGGELVQCSGDRLLAVFAQAQAAVLAAQDMAELMRLFHAERGMAGLPPVRCGTGVARGAVTLGSASTTRCTAFACVGAPVRRATLLAEACAAAGLSCLLDEAVRCDLPAQIETCALATPVGEIAAFRVV